MNGGTMQIRLRPEYRGKLLAFVLVVAVVAVILFMNGYSGISEPDTFKMDQGMGEGGEIIHGIIFDAGSTGSRIHVIRLRKESGKPLQFMGDLFEQIKPGLSDYADDPKAGAASLVPLLDKAKSHIPTPQWSETPIALKATAGLRLLSEEKSNALLSAVSALFNKSPFRVGPNAVQIMEGNDEGVFSWFTLNFLAGAFTSKKYISVMDLGGGSTQITFVPKTAEEVQKAPDGYILEKDVLGESIKLYSHSYLRYGLMSGRLQMVGGSESQENSADFTSSCFGPEQVGEFKLGSNKYTIKGTASGSSFEDCYQAAKKVIFSAKIDQPALDDSDKHKVALISYYFDRAVETSLIDADAGGDIKVQDYIKVGKKACAKPDNKHPFLCLDLCYIISLLQDGFGLDNNTPIMLRKQIDGTEISWALGAMFEVLKDPAVPPAAR